MIVFRLCLRSKGRWIRQNTGRIYVWNNPPTYRPTTTKMVPLLQFSWMMTGSLRTTNSKSKVDQRLAKLLFKLRLKKTRVQLPNSVPPATTASKNASTEHNDVPDLIAEPAATQQREQPRSSQRETSAHQRESVSTAKAPSAAPTSQESTGLSSSSPFRRLARLNKGVLQTKRFMDEVYLNSLYCFADPGSYQAQLAYLAEVLTCSDSGVINMLIQECMLPKCVVATLTTLPTSKLSMEPIQRNT